MERYKSSAQDNLQSSLDEELLMLLANQAKMSPFNMLAAMGIIAYLIQPHIPDQPWLWAGWLLLVACSQFYRRHRLLSLPDQVDRPIAERTAEAARIQQLCTGIMAISFLAFPLLTPFEAAMMTMFFIAMGVGSIVAVIGWPPYAKAHILGHLIPLFILWAWSGYSGPVGTIGYLCALIGTSYSATMWTFSKRLFAMNTEFFDNRSALAQALKDAEAANMAKSRFLAAASHDLRQPVHTLSLLSATLKNRALDDRTRVISTTMEDAVKALSSELDALLDISKLDAGVVPVNRESFDLTGLLTRIVSGLQERVAQAGISLNLQCSGPDTCHTDPVLLERILRNLLENSLVHNRNCEILVSVIPQQGGLRLSIADTGTGIPEQEKQKVFEEFYQVNNPERDRASGLGLGLAIVERLSHLLDLQMNFTSEEGQGTQFSFFLPIGEAVIKSKDLPVSEVDFRGVKLLVVDNEQSIRVAMRELLESLGFEVETVKDERSACVSARQNPPDLALVDLRLLNHGSGIATVGALREIQPDLPAIIISGDTSAERLQEVRSAGLSMLHKPASESALIKAINEQLDVGAS